MNNPAQLAELIDQISVDLDHDSAVVEGEKLEAADATALRRELPNLIYQVMHAGHRFGAGELPFHLRDSAFEEQLAAATAPRETTVAVRPVEPPPEARPRADEVLVERDGVRVWVPAERVRTAADGTTLLRANAARPAVSPGFYLVNSTVPLRGNGPTLRIYLHVHDADSAPLIWSTVLEHLEGLGAAYRAKVLSSRLLYPRRDAIVVYLPEQSWQYADGLATAIGWLPGLAEDTSAFARRLAPGVAAAWEPSDQRRSARGLSFGQHRASALGNAIVDAAKAGTERRAEVETAFAEANIDPSDVSRNGDSPHTPGLFARDTAADVSRVRTPDLNISIR